MTMSVIQYFILCPCLDQMVGHTMFKSTSLTFSHKLTE